MTQRRKRNKKWISWIIILALLVGAVVVCFLVKNAYFDDKKVPEGNSQSAPSEKKGSEPTKKEEKEEKKEEIPVEEKERVQQYDGIDPNTTSGITGVITYAGVSGENLMIRINIDQFLNGGKCTLSLRQGGGNVYSTEANVIDSASTSTCEGFNVPVSGLPKGNINIVIYIASGDKSGEIVGEVAL